MRRSVIYHPALVVAGLAAGTAQAQNSSSQSSSSQQQLDIAAAKAQRKAIVGQNMYLTGAQAKVLLALVRLLRTADGQNRRSPYSGDQELRRQL